MLAGAAIGRSRHPSNARGAHHSSGSRCLHRWHLGFGNQFVFSNPAPYAVLRTQTTFTTTELGRINLFTPDFFDTPLLVVTHLNHPAQVASCAHYL